MNPIGDLLIDANLADQDVFSLIETELGMRLGWAEITIVIRFWIICGLCVALGLGAFYAEWTVGLP